MDNNKTKKKIAMYFLLEKLLAVTGVFVLAMGTYMYMSLTHVHQRTIEKLLPTAFDTTSALYQTINYYEDVLEKNNIQVDKSEVVIDSMYGDIKLLGMINAAKEDTLKSKGEMEGTSAIETAKTVNKLFNDEFKDDWGYQLLVGEYSLYYWMLGFLPYFAFTILRRIRVPKLKKQLEEK